MKRPSTQPPSLSNWKATRDSQPPLESLFNYSHFDFYELTWLQRIQLILYVPIGISLLVIRFILFCVFGCIFLLLPGQFFFPQWLARILMVIFGIVVRIQRKKDESIGQVIITANHRTPFDVFPFLAVTNVNVLIGTCNCV